MSTEEVPKEFVKALQELGLTKSNALQGSPLTGGVSSDIWRISSVPTFSHQGFVS